MKEAVEEKLGFALLIAGGVLFQPRDEFGKFRMVERSKPGANRGSFYRLPASALALLDSLLGR